MPRPTGQQRLRRGVEWQPDETQTMTGEPIVRAVSQDEPATPLTSSVPRKTYDPFYERRIDMRGSPIKGEQVCGWIASLWREDLACLIVGLPWPEWEEFKLDNPAALDEALLLASGMAYAEMRASALGINNRRNQKTMAVSIIHLMNLPLGKDGKVVGGQKVPLTGLEGLSDEEIDALADLQES